MNLTTCGTNYYPQYTLDMVYAGVNGMEDIEGFGTRYRLLLIRLGTGIMRAQNRRFLLQSPAFYCFNEREEIERLDGTGIMAVSLYFHPNFINRKLTFDLSGNDDLSVTDGQDLWCLKPFEERTPAYYGCIPLDPALSRHAERIMEELGFNLQNQPDNSWPCRSRSLLLELLFLVGRVYQRGETGPQCIPDTSSDGMDELLLFLHSNYNAKLKLEDIARNFNTNKTTLNQIFKMHTGNSVMAYLNVFRMQMASSMLRNTLLSRDEIASRVGFKDSAHFNRSFSKYSGYSPSAYRSNFCWMLK